MSTPGRYPRRATPSRYARASVSPEKAGETGVAGRTRRQGSAQAQGAGMPATALNVPQTYGGPSYGSPDRNVERDAGAADIGHFMAPAVGSAAFRDRGSRAGTSSPSKSTRREASEETSDVYPNTRSRRQASATAASQVSGSAASSPRSETGPKLRRHQTRRGQQAPAATLSQVDEALSSPSGQLDVSATFGDESGEFGTTDVGARPSRRRAPVTRSSSSSTSRAKSYSPGTYELQVPQQMAGQSAGMDWQTGTWTRGFRALQSFLTTIQALVRELSGWIVVAGLIYLLVSVMWGAVLPKSLQLDGLSRGDLADGQDPTQWGSGSTVEDGNAATWRMPFVSRLKSPSGLLSDLVERLTGVEKDVQAIKLHMRLHDASIEKLQETIPEYVAVTKARDGKVEIDNDFWAALKQKIELDFDGLTGSDEAGTATSLENTQHAARKHWSDFLTRNQRRVSEVLYGGQTPYRRGARNDTVVTRREFLDLLQANHAQHHEEVSRLGERIENKYREVKTDAVARMHDVAYEVASTVASQTFKNAIPAAQLDALAQANLKLSSEAALRKVNFFSPGLGAVVDPHLTSPTYVKPYSLAERGLNAALNLGIRKPNPPVTALKSWDDVGESWCSPTEDGQAQLAVQMPRAIYPTEVTIEHVPQEATLDISSAPNEVEIFAQVDENARADVQQLASMRLGPERVVANDLLDKSFVRIGVAMYDVNAVSHVQTFPVQVDMARYGASVRKLVVRSRLNWGHDEYTCLYRVRVHGELA